MTKVKIVKLVPVPKNHASQQAEKRAMQAYITSPYRGNLNAKDLNSWIVLNDRHSEVVGGDAYLVQNKIMRSVKVWIAKTDCN